MKHALWIALIPLALAGCLLEKSKDDSFPTLSEWGGTVHDFYPLVSVEGGRLIPDPDKCDGDWAATRTMSYRIHEDSLDLRWTYTYSLDGWKTTDSFYIAGVYHRSTPGAGVRGGWKLDVYRQWNSGETLDSVRQAALAKWSFVYQGEEAYIGEKILAFSYPRLWIYALRSAEYELRAPDEGIDFEYVGKDSLRIVRDGETVGLRYKPFQFLRAHSSLEERASIQADLTDSCASAGKVVDTTWIKKFVWATPGKSAVSEKSAAFGNRSASTELAFKHR